MSLHSNSYKTSLNSRKNKMFIIPLPQGISPSTFCVMFIQHYQVTQLDSKLCCSKLGNPVAVQQFDEISHFLYGYEGIG